MSAPRLALAAAPDDIERIRGIAALIASVEQDKAFPEADYTDAFSKLVMRNAGAILNENALPASLIRVDGSALRRRVTAEVEGRVGAAFAQKGAARRDALYSALTHFSERAVADDLVAEWLGASVVGRYADESVKVLETAERDAATAAVAAADAARGSHPMTTAERITAGTQSLLSDARASDEVRTARLAERFRLQVQVSPSAGELRVRTSEVKLVSDEGGAGAHNGVADAGEWLRFAVPIENTGRESWYSASAWVRSETDCAFSGDAREVQLPEMAPKEVASVEIHAYISESCADGTRVPFIVEIRDSVRAPTTPITFDVGVVVTNIGKPKLRGLRIDADVPGSSDGSARPTLAKGRDIELSAGIQLAKAGAVGAVQGWGLSNDLEPVIKESGYRLGGKMTAVDAGAAFLPFDDLDVAAKGAATFAEGTASVASRRRWTTAEDAGGVAVVEARVSYPGIEGAWAPVASVPIPAPPPVPPAALPTPSAAATLAMLRDVISIEAREVDPEGDALAAVTPTIFDVEVDESAFAVKWCRATTPSAPGKPDACDPNAKVEAPAELPPITVALPAFTDPAVYTVRSYVWVPMAWEPEAPQRAEEPVAGTPRPARAEIVTLDEPEPAPVRTQREATPFGISAGVELGSVTLRMDEGADFLTSTYSNAEPQLWVDAALGKQGLCAHVDAAVSLGLSATLLNAQSMTAMRIGTGGGYVFRIMQRWIELEPDVYVGVRFVSIDGDFGNKNGAAGEARILSPYVEPSVSARWFPIQPLSIDVRLSYRLQLADEHTGPVTIDVANTTGLKFQLGAGLHF
ncbi:MAG: hypothetical protein EXR71_20995 [Myxococcales bacterium]|nr:hypothetical protein [Myxococcales bacterium]